MRSGQDNEKYVIEYPSCVFYSCPIDLTAGAIRDNRNDPEIRCKGHFIEERLAHNCEKCTLRHRPEQPASPRKAA